MFSIQCTNVTWREYAFKLCPKTTYSWELNTQNTYNTTKYRNASISQNNNGECFQGENDENSQTLPGHACCPTNNTFNLAHFPTTLQQADKPRLQLMSPSCVHHFLVSPLNSCHCRLYFLRHVSAFGRVFSLCSISLNAARVVTLVKVFYSSSHRNACFEITIGLSNHKWLSCTPYIGYISRNASFVRLNVRSWRLRKAACGCLLRKAAWIALWTRLNRSCRKHSNRYWCCRWEAATDHIKPTLTDSSVPVVTLKAKTL